jgi:hypothetical protein
MALTKEERKPAGSGQKKMNLAAAGLTAFRPDFRGQQLGEVESMASTNHGSCAWTGRWLRDKQLADAGKQKGMWMGGVAGDIDVGCQFSRATRADRLTISPRVASAART